MLCLDEIVRCPRCLQPLQGLSVCAPQCSNPACEFAVKGFLTIDGQPVLIDFERSIFGPAAFARGCGSVMLRDYRGSNSTPVRRFIYGRNKVAQQKAAEFLKRLTAINGKPRVLVVGGGVLGSGSDALYASDEIDLIGLDVYASPHTRLVADAHRLPFQDEGFDGVWIQAVLEHVLDPNTVVAEIFRVLRPRGLVYAETPFMQPVHEGAYDFTRFTRSGHRWMFRQFEEIESGAVAGAGSAAFCSLRYLLRALGLGRTHLEIPFFWLRLADGLTKRAPNADAASCIFFLGAKSERMLGPKDMVAYYSTF
jgi:SAM-dependent methyltransferase